MKSPGISTLLLASAVAAAVVLAPAANARTTCETSPTKSRCETSGSVSIKAKPGTIAPPANQPMFPWMGAGLPGAE